METNRKDFLKLAGMGSLGMMAGKQDTDRSPFWQSYEQQFNMQGYAAPKLDPVRVGLIGIGSRGSGHVERFSRIEGVEIKALCDLYANRVNDAIESIQEYSQHDPEAYSGREEAWKKVCERQDIDLIITATPWKLHTPIAVYAMEHDKHVGVEVPAAKTIEECWQLVETSERTRKHCMIMENACYGDFNLLTLNMAREGFLGEVIHGEGAYIHDRVHQEYRWDRQEDNHNWFGYRPWRLKENANRNGNLYPTHGLGTVAQAMNLNYGDQMDYLVSISTKDFSLADKMGELAQKDDYYKAYEGLEFRGNMNTSIIRTHKGRTIMVQHDISSPRPNVRFNIISGTKGIAQAYPQPGQIATSHEGWVPEEKLKSLKEKYTPEIVKRVGEITKEIGGHGGVDTMMTWRMIDCLRNGLPLDMDVYDAALWSSIAPLSEWSVAHEGQPVSVPDFTDGSWKINEPNMDIQLKQAGKTKIIS